MASAKDNSANKLKVALVHDYLREYGGGERVLEALHEIFPDAPVYVSFLDKKALGPHWQRFKNWDIRQTWLARIPFIKKTFSPLRVLADKAFASLDLSEFDIVISSSNMYQAKAVQVPNGTHYCYCHTPPRALYGYNTMTNWKKNPLIRIVGELINHYMRIIDFKVAQNVDHFIANSQETQRRIEKFYRRESTVIYPPVNIPTKAELKSYQKTAAEKLTTDYYLYLSRYAYNKHPELAVQAANQLGFKLKMVGSGKMKPKLEEMAGHNVEFLSDISDEELHILMAGAKGFLYPVEDEDFGIVPVEAMAHGLPVIAHRSGGPVESVVEDKTGVFFEEINLESFIKAIQKFEKMKFNADEIHQHSTQFSDAKFEENILKLIKTDLKK